MVLPTLALVLLALLALLMLAPSATAEDVERSEPWEFRSQWGWFEGDRIHFYDLGRASNTTAPVYRLVDAAGDPVEGQHMIFPDLRLGVLVGVPHSANYSDFHRVWDVGVPAGYVPDTLRSFAELVEADLPMTRTDIVWNSPMVPANSTLVGVDADQHPLTEGWWEGVAVHYFRFETSLDTPGLFDPATGLVSNTSSMAVFDPPGQLDILLTYPGDTTHSPLSRLYIFNPISTEYVADEVRSWKEAEALGFLIFPEGNMYNRPVVGGKEAYPRFQYAEPTVYDLKEAWSDQTSKVFYYDMGPVVEGQARLYRFVTAEGLPIIAQHCLVEVVAPGVLLGDVATIGYSTTWRYYDIIVEDEAAFQPDVIKSMVDVRAMGYSINSTLEFMVAPMITRDAVFNPVPSNPPGEGLVLVWYQGAGVYLNLMDPDGDTIDVLVDPADGENGGLVVEYRTVNSTIILDAEGTPYPFERPILETLPTDETNYSVIWSVIEASGGEGYRQGRFRTRGQLDERGWSFGHSGAMTLAGFVAGPINVPAWKPERFTFVVGPVVDEDGKAIKGVDVRVSRGVEVVEGLTDAAGEVGFQVDSTWNDQTVQTFLSKEGFFNSNFPGEIEDYEHFVPSGGYVPPMVRVDDGSGLEGATTFALVGVLVIVLFVIVLLIKGRSGKEPSISDEEADRILADEAEEADEADEADEEQEGDEEEETSPGKGGDHLTEEDVKDLERGPEHTT